MDARIASSKGQRSFGWQTTVLPPTYQSFVNKVPTFEYQHPFLITILENKTTLELVLVNYLLMFNQHSSYQRVR